jgi:hypothetical protein
MTFSALISKIKSFSFSHDTLRLKMTAVKVWIKNTLKFSYLFHPSFIFQLVIFVLHVFPNIFKNFQEVQKLRWPRSATPNISETSNSNYKHQIQITNIKFKFVTSNLNSSHQIQIHHIKFKFITSNSNSPHQIQIHHIKFKFITSNAWSAVFHWTTLLLHIITISQ